jgi:bifunctional DNA-binding transcriptional regulator/antitoxin component of YhaV-PrlF toxin-antitoxin module
MIPFLKVKKENLMLEKNNRWIITPEEDPVTGEVIITFPLELLEQVGWMEGDTLNWSVRDDGSVYLTKKEEIDKKSESC